MKIVVAITGASGTIYARKLIETLLSVKDVEVLVIFSEYGKAVAIHEGEYDALSVLKGVEFADNNNMFCSAASGSSKVDGMVIIPSSVSTLARIASGTSNNLITRTADVMLKERRKLVICLRETPLSLIHIENMRSVTLAGAVVMPLSPSFYSHPSTIDQLIVTQTERAISLLGIEVERYVFEG